MARFQEPMGKRLGGRSVKPLELVLAHTEEARRHNPGPHRFNPGPR
jgi:hypothetical protein